MKCLVAGGLGFIGRAIVKHLAATGNDVVVMDSAKPYFELPAGVQFVPGDTRYYENLYDVCKHCDVDEIYEIAGLLGTSELMRDNKKAVDVNINGTLNVLQVAHDTVVKRVFYPTKPNGWLNTYSITKEAAEKFCFMYVQNVGLHVVVMKWLNVYGPGQKLFPVRKAVPLFVVQALRNLPIDIWGDGEQEMDMVYVDDVARLTVHGLRMPELVGKVWDVRTGEYVSVNTVVKAILALTNSKSELRYHPMRSGEPANDDGPAPKVNKLSDVVDCQFTDLHTGLLRTIEYYEHLATADVDRALAYFNM